MTGWDTFDAPPEPAWIGDFSTLKRAEAVARQHDKPFFECVVYNDRGEVVCGHISTSFGALRQALEHHSR